MVSGYVLIVAVMLLGGIIATVGDRIGTRVGKARLSLFNLRPRQTATLVSIATGSVISASTLAILFGISSQLRTGVFELSQIQADLEATQAELEQAEQEQTQVADELTAATGERERARKRLREINQSLQAAQQRQQTTQAQLGTTQTQLSQTRNQLASISQQTSGLRAEISRLQQERTSLQQQQQAIRGQIAERDQEIAERDQEIAERDAAIAQREQLLVQLETQQQFLSQQINALERQYQGLFRGNIAVGRNQELGSGVIRVNDPDDAIQFITRLIYEANRTVLERIAPGTPPEQQVVLIGTREVEALAERLSNGQEYVVRVFSAANYIIGEPCVARAQEPCVQIFTDATLNRLIYDNGERIASASVESERPSQFELLEQLNRLVAATQFRASQDGVIGTTVQISDGRAETLMTFLEQVKNYGGPVQLQAIAATPIFTTGPIQIELVAIKDGNLLFETRPELPPSGASSQN